MKIRIKRIDKDLPLPVYQTQKSVGFDLLTREDTVVKAKEVGLIPCNIIVEIPSDYFLMLVSRSSTPRKRGLFSPHGVGIIDQDYCGPEDEIVTQFYNNSNEDIVVKRGERVAQGLILPVERIEWEEIDEIEKPSRGGIGSTG